MNFTRQFCIIYIYIYTSSIYPALPGQYRLKSSSSIRLASKKGDGGEDVLLRENAKIPFLAFSHNHGNHFAKFLAHVLSLVKTYRHAKFQRNPPNGLAGMMVQTCRQTDRQTDTVFPKHATWLKTISGWVSSIPKSLVKI